MEKSTRKTVNLMHDTVDEEQTVAEKRTSEKKIELHSYAQEILTDIEYRQQFKVRGVTSSNTLPNPARHTLTHIRPNPAGEGGGRWRRA